MQAGICQHAHLCCADLDAMIDFWVKGFGATFEEFRQFGENRGAVLDMRSATKLYLKEMPCQRQDAASPRAGVEHLGVDVENLDACLEHLVSLPGVELTRPPFLSKVARCAFVRGPEGVLVEIMEPLQKTA